MRDASTYRAARRNVGRNLNNTVLKLNRRALGISRKEMDRQRGKKLGGAA